MDASDKPAGSVLGVVPQAEATRSAAATTRPGHDIVVIGASAGGLAALRAMCAALPRDLDAALFVVVHISADFPSELAQILARAGPLPAVAAEDGMAIEHGRLLVAPPDHHLLVEPGRVVVVRGPRENRHRPAIDPLFRSAAWAYGPRVVGVVLSGGLDDGTAGLWAIKSCGGTTVVQDPADAAQPDMPANALMHNRIDHRLPAAEIAPLLARLAHEPVPHARPVPPQSLKTEVEFAKSQGDISDMASLGSLTPFTCPSCRGALWELDEGGHLRYRCHTGHAFTQDALLVEQNIETENALYAALRALEEKATALRRISERWPERYPVMRNDYEARAREIDAAADQLRGLLAGAAT